MKFIEIRRRGSVAAGELVLIKRTAHISGFSFGLPHALIIADEVTSIEVRP